MSILEHLAEIAAVLLLLWAAVLVWASWQLHIVAKELEAERREIRRWQRLYALHKSQNVKWQ